jgi:hypothetical protein
MSLFFFELGASEFELVAVGLFKTLILKSLCRIVSLVMRFVIVTFQMTGAARFSEYNRAKRYENEQPLRYFE